LSHSTSEARNEVPALTLPTTRSFKVIAAPHVKMWVIEPHRKPNPDIDGVNEVKLTFVEHGEKEFADQLAEGSRDPDGETIELDEYVADRVGWVLPLADGFSRMEHVRLKGMRRDVAVSVPANDENHLAGAGSTSKTKPSSAIPRGTSGYRISAEFCEVAGVSLCVEVVRLRWPKSAIRNNWEAKDNKEDDFSGGETESNEDSDRDSTSDQDKHDRGEDFDLKRLGKSIRDQVRHLSGVYPGLHVVVYFEPSFLMPKEDASDWFDQCEKVIKGFGGQREQEEGLQLEEISPWLAMACTPWATFVTRRPSGFKLNVVEARIRHLVVDPVILATAQQTRVQEFVEVVSELSFDSANPDSTASRQARDSFYQWRSSFWWAQPAKAKIPNRVWKAAAEANNTISQVDALSQEMHDYASVEEDRQKQKSQQLNVRLAWGALVFAVLAIAVPLVYEEAGLLVTLAFALLVVVLGGAAIGCLQWIRRSRR